MVNDLTGDRAKGFFAFNQFPLGFPIADEFLGKRKTVCLEYGRRRFKGQRVAGISFGIATQRGRELLPRQTAQVAAVRFAWSLQGAGNRGFPLRPLARPRAFLRGAAESSAPPDGNQSHRQ